MDFLRDIQKLIKKTVDVVEGHPYAQTFAMAPPPQSIQQQQRNHKAAYARSRRNNNRSRAYSA
ncbi:hypothetical protein QQ054_02590 [Oscillatoria amoena NRMC-F 0135]|nr:hypothetical protein [Oscillatoria amoena NRMC-F 0135]